MPRAVTIPVAGPVGATWEDLRKVLREHFQDTTRIANWAVTQLSAAEAPRTRDQEKIPKAPRVYLYPGARKLAPDLPTGSVVALLNDVEGNYKKRRLRSYWQCRESSPSFRYPVPLPIPAQVWRTATLEDGRPGISLRLGDSRWALRLRGGRNFRRQLADYRRLEEGSAIAGVLVLLEKRSQYSDHRPAGTRSGTKGARLMAKLVGWFPRQEHRLDPQRTLTIKTAADAAAVWSVDGESHPYHADHVRVWLAGHARRLERWANDLQRQHRLPVAERKRMVHDHEAALAKHHNRMKSWVKQTCAAWGKVAISRRCGRLVYDDTERSYCSLPWSVIRVQLQQVCHAAGIELELSASGGVVPP